MKYTQISRRVVDELNRLKKEPFDEKNCFENPSDFAHHFLGMTPYKYQHLILRRFRDNPGEKLKNDRIIVCKGRQMGISFLFAWLGIWSAFWNKFPSGPFKDTKVAIVSRSENQAKKLMGEIQKLIWNSPQKLGDFVVKDRRTKSLSKSEIHFEKGWIKCFPPTDAILGETIDLLIIDEAAMVDDEIYNTAMKPTISKSDGKILLSSTPRGQKGYFYETFDPFDLRKTHDFVRYWFYWKMCEDPIQLRIIKDEFNNYKDIGNLKKFEQEYNGQFTVDEMAFFENNDVDKNVDSNLSEVFEYHETPVCIGVDYGGVNSETCITVVTKANNKVILLYQWGKAEFDYNLLMDDSWENSFSNLKKRYNIEKIMADDCPPAIQSIQWLENEGYPVEKFNFRSDQMAGERNRGYYLFRNFLKKGKINYPNNKKLLAQMKTIQETQMEITTRIKAPKNYRDDRIDSFMMACHPFLREDSNFSSRYVDFSKISERILLENREKNNSRHDKEWDKHTNKDTAYDFLLRKKKKSNKKMFEGGDYFHASDSKGGK